MNTCRTSFFLPLLLLLVLGGLVSGCNPAYVARAGWSQASILASRVPFEQIIVDPDTDEATRGKLLLVLEARTFARDNLGFQNMGEAYTSLAELRTDTLALVLSAVYPDRLAFRSWWFPITGHVPYRAYFSTRSGEAARDRLEAQGFDTDLRPTAAFSTLGWFADPLYSSLLRLDPVALVETVLHELAHNHLFIPSQGKFNESFATWAGLAGSVAFFCTRPGGGPDTVWCHRARDRQTDARLVSRYLMELEGSIRALYESGDPEAPALRFARYAEAQEHFLQAVEPQLRASRYPALSQRPLNNATLLARALYYHELEGFDRLLDAEGGDLAATLARLRKEAPETPDPFTLLPPAREPRP
jgi:predicted aminopeptidase